MIALAPPEVILVGPNKPLELSINPVKPVMALVAQAGEGQVLPLTSSSIQIAGSTLSSLPVAFHSWVMPDLNLYVGPLESLDSNPDLTVTVPEENLNPDILGLYTYPPSRLALGVRMLAQFNFEPTAGPVTATLTYEDLLSAAGVQDLDVVLTLYHQDGSRAVYVTRVHLDGVPPRGTLEYAMAESRGIGYYFVLDDDVAEIRIVFPDGSTTHPVRPGVRRGLVISHHAGKPTAAYAIDQAGNESTNILTRVYQSPFPDDRTSALSGWPLPPELKPDRPNLKVLLAAFEQGLALKADYAGDYLNFERTQGLRLDALASIFGVRRTSGISDEVMRDKLRLLLLKNTHSPTGMEEALSSIHRQQVLVEDGTPLDVIYPKFNRQYKFNGQIKFAGSLDLNTYGRFRVIFQDVPLDSWDATHATVRALKLKGTVHTLVLRLPPQEILSFPSPSVTMKLRFPPVTIQTMGVVATGSGGALPIKFNGQFKFDGTKKFNDFIPTNEPL